MASAEEAQEEAQLTSPTIIGEQQGVRQRLPSQDIRQRRRRFAGSMAGGGGRTSGSYLRRLRENLRKPVVGAKNHLRLLVWLLMGSVLFSAVLCIFWHSLLSLTLNPKSEP